MTDDNPDDAPGRRPARDLAGSTKTVSIDRSLEEALTELVHDDGTGIGVTNEQGDVVGWLDHRSLLAGLAVH